MDQFTAILMAIFALAVLLVIGVYNKADSRRFRLDRLLNRERAAIEAWVAECERLQAGASADYRASKKNWQRSACLQAMVGAVKENSEKKLELQEQLLDFCYSFRLAAQEYNKKLEDPLTGKLLHLMGFRPYTALDFYPDVVVAKDEPALTQDETESAHEE